MREEVVLLNGVVLSEDYAVHEVEVVALDGKFVARLAKETSLRTYIEALELDVLAVSDGRNGAKLATLLCLQYHDASVAFLGRHLDGNLAVTAALKHLDGSDGVSSRNVNLLYLVEVGAVEEQRTSTQYRTRTESLHSDIRTILVSAEVVVVAGCQR